MKFTIGKNKYKQTCMECNRKGNDLIVITDASDDIVHVKCVMRNRMTKTSTNKKCKKCSRVIHKNETKIYMFNDSAISVIWFHVSCLK